MIALVGLLGVGAIVAGATREAALGPCVDTKTEESFVDRPTPTDSDPRRARIACNVELDEQAARRSVDTRRSVHYGDDVDAACRRSVGSTTTAIRLARISGVWPHPELVDETLGLFARTQLETSALLFSSITFQRSDGTDTAEVGGGLLGERSLVLPTDQKVLRKLFPMSAGAIAASDVLVSNFAQYCRFVGCSAAYRSYGASTAHLECIEISGATASVTIVDDRSGIRLMSEDDLSSADAGFENIAFSLKLQLTERIRSSI